MFLHVCLVPLSCLVPAEDNRGCLVPWNLSYNRCCRLPHGCWDLDLLKEHLCSWPLSQSAALPGHPVIPHWVCILAHVMPKQVWPRHQRLEKDLQQVRAARSYFQNNALFEQREHGDFIQKTKTHPHRKILYGWGHSWAGTVKDIFQQVHCKVQERKIVDTFLGVLIWRSWT